MAIDPATVVIVLCAHLLSMGVVMYLAARRLPDGLDLRLIAAGAVALGLGYVIQLFWKVFGGGPVAVLRDTLVAIAPVFFLAGFRRFFGVGTLALRTIGFVALAYAVLVSLAMALGGHQARYVLLNAWSAVVNLMVGLLLLRQALSGDRVYRAGTWVIAVVALCLVSIQALKAVEIALLGEQAAALQGITQMIFYGFASLSAVVMAPTVIWLMFVRLTQHLQRIAIRDALTQTFNRNGVDLMLGRHFARRDAQALILLMLDLDHFKSINDRFGHPAGDAVLKTVAQLLQQHVRGGDFVARLGGEEFAVCCDTPAPDVARELAERLRVLIESARTRVEQAASDGLACTVSIGVSRPFSSAAEFERAMREADEALYQAKHRGRNQVVVAGEFSSEAT